MGEEVKLFSEYFKYDPSAPSCLRRVCAIYSGKDRTTLTCTEDALVGYIRNGYWIVKVKQKAVFCHKIVWFLHTGEYSKEYEIDHINGNSQDNRIENLRKVSHAENCRNRKKSLLNTSGITGVSQTSDNLGWRARTQVNGKAFEKLFYGENSYELACLERVSQLRLANLLGDNYSKRHGKTQILSKEKACQ